MVPRYAVSSSHGLKSRRQTSPPSSGGMRYSVFVTSIGLVTYMCMQMFFSARMSATARNELTASQEDFSMLLPPSHPEGARGSGAQGVPIAHHRHSRFLARDQERDAASFTSPYDHRNHSNSQPQTLSTNCHSLTIARIVLFSTDMAQIFPGLTTGAHHDNKPHRDQPWLQTEANPLPYAHAPQHPGVSDGCVKHKNHPDRCRIMTSGVLTQVQLLQQVAALPQDADHPHGSTATLVLHEDARVPDLSRLWDSLAEVPSDWDVVRWHCADALDRLRPYTRVTDGVLATDADLLCRAMHATAMASQTISHPAKRKQPPRKVHCEYCSGPLHAYLVRDTSIPRLVALWNATPYDDLDCRLTTTQLKTYCVNPPGVTKTEEHWIQVGSRPNQEILEIR